MKLKSLAWMITAVALVSTSPTGTARATGGQAHGGQAHAGDASGPLPSAVREATRRFQDPNVAIAAGYAQSDVCVSGPEKGAMGIHYANLSLFDDRLDVENPEVLVYEPRKNGQLELVAAEYITPAAAWQASNPPGTQPVLNGHLLHFVNGPNRYGPDAFYELHVWAWRGNPSGTFADWNPKVSCAPWGGGS